MHEAAAGGPTPEGVGGTELPGDPDAGSIRAGLLASLRRLAEVEGEAEWAEALLEGLRALGLHGHDLALEATEWLARPQLLAAGNESSGQPAIGHREPLDLAALFRHADATTRSLAEALLSAAGGSLRRVREDQRRQSALWQAIQSLEACSGGPALLEAIALHARRLCNSSHAEVRSLAPTGMERHGCSELQGISLDRRPCCREAERGAFRMALRHCGRNRGELLVAGPPPDAEAMAGLRHFVHCAASLLDAELLREEAALHAQEEIRVRERESRFELALAHAPVVLATLDRELRYTWIHPDRDEWIAAILGRTDFDILMPHEALRLQLLKRRVLDVGLPVQEEVSITWQGKLRTFQLTAAPIRDPWGTVTGVALAAIDVTRRVREAGARELLLSQREDERSWLLTVIDRSPVGILLVETGPDGDRITTNRRAVELIGHYLDPVRGREAMVGRLLRPDGTPFTREDLPSARALRGERVSMEEAILRRLDGRRIPVVVSAGPVVDAAGRQAGAIVTFDDISPFKEMERLREEWTSLITHDLRQPIASIAGFAAVLAEHPEMPAALRTKVVHILAAARRLGRMTGDLLEASRLASNQLSLERRPCDLTQLVTETVERLAGELQDHPVRIERRGELPLLPVDPERLEQVLGNLLSNAAKYSPPGSEIEVELERRGQEVAVGVTNRGPGLAVEELGAVFSRFHRTERARRSRVPGLGLGLYIARGLVEAHGGRIWAESDPGRSVTFRFALPIAGG